MLSWWLEQIELNKKVEHFSLHSINPDHETQKPIQNVVDAENQFRFWPKSHFGRLKKL